MVGEMEEGANAVEALTVCSLSRTGSGSRLAPLGGGIARRRERLL